MIPLPLADLQLRPSHHSSALWWLWLGYRRPASFGEGLYYLARNALYIRLLILVLHATPYLAIVVILTFVPLSTIMQAFFAHFLSEYNVIQFVVKSITIIIFAISFLIFLVLALTRFSLISISVITSIVFGILLGLHSPASLGIVLGIILSAAPICVINMTGRKGALWSIFSMVFCYGMLISEQLRLGFAVLLFVAIVSIKESLMGLRILTSLFVAYIMFQFFVSIESQIIDLETSVIISLIAAFRIYYYLYHFLILAIPEWRWYPSHPVSWDDMCWLPFLGLHRLLVDYAEAEPERGSDEIARLIAGYPSQRLEALKARTILIARAAASEIELSRLEQCVAGLPEGDSGFLKQTAQVRESVAAIAHQQRRLHAGQLPAFRKENAGNLVTLIETFYNRIAGFNEPVRSEFEKAAHSWLQVARRQYEAEKQKVAGERVPAVFEGGRPIDRQEGAFLPRMWVIERLCGQIAAPTGCPGLQLYGRRRMGKTTLLRNLDDFLPPEIHISLVEMEYAQALESLSSLLTWTIEQVIRAVNLPDLAPRTPKTLAAFMAALEQIDQLLAERGEQLLLAFDEFEVIDLKIGEVFPVDLLRTIRQSIQSHRRIVWLFAGGNELAELSHAEWASYLVNLQKIEIPPFRFEETQELLMDPLKHAKNSSATVGSLPRFDAAFWGNAGVTYIHREAAGWPNFVQLLAEKSVAIANQRKVEQVTDDILETAAIESLVSGEPAFYKILVAENRLPGEWDYLLGFRERETQPPPEDFEVRRSLRRRLLVVNEKDLWRMRVPLMRRWLIERS